MKINEASMHYNTMGIIKIYRKSPFILILMIPRISYFIYLNEYVLTFLKQCKNLKINCDEFKYVFIYYLKFNSGIILNYFTFIYDRLFG